MSRAARVVQYTQSITGSQTGDRSRRPVTVDEFATCWQLSVFLHTYTNVCGVIILERGILLHFFCMFVSVVCGLSRSVTPFGDPLQFGCVGPV